MDENEKKIKDGSEASETESTESSGVTNEEGSTADTAETVENDAAKADETEESTDVAEADETGETGGKGGNKKLRNAIIRMAAGIVAAVLLLVVTGFAPIKLLKGPEESDAIQDNDAGDFVERDIYAILGFYADSENSKDETVGRYAVVPMNGELVSVYFTKRYLDSADSVCDATYDFINGDVSSLDSYVTVEGTVGTLDEDASGLMYDWFGTNKDQMVEMNLIADTDDYSDYLSDDVLIVDTVNGYSETAVLITGILAALCALYAVVEIVLMATGFYLPKTAVTVAADDGEDSASGDDEDENTDGTEEESAESENADDAEKESAKDDSTEGETGDENADDAKPGDEAKEKAEEPEDKE